MKELYRLLGIEATMSTAYHLQTNRQMERVNQELEQYLRIFVEERQDDWYIIMLLPLAEFSFGSRGGSLKGSERNSWRDASKFSSRVSI